MCLSYSAARREDPGTAWQFAHTASQHTPDDPRATAWATARVGLYAAHLGDREAAETAMQRSLEIGGNLPNPRPRSPETWTSASPPTSSTRSSTSSCPTPTPAPSENYSRN